MRTKKLVKMRNFIVVMVAVILLFNTSLLKVAAAEKVVPEMERMEVAVESFVRNDLNKVPMTRAALSECSISIGYQTEGMLIVIYTGASREVPVLGIKDVKVQQKVWYGWKDVAYADGAETYNNTGISCTMTFTGAQVGETYRVSCVHYADLTDDGVTQYTELEGNTGAFTYNS